MKGNKDTFTNLTSWQLPIEKTNKLAAISLHLLLQTTKEKS